MTALNMQFKRDGTGVVVDQALVNQFPLFHGKAPPGHPYPQAFTEGATDTRFCFVETVGDWRRQMSAAKPNVICFDLVDMACDDCAAQVKLKATTFPIMLQVNIP